MYASVNDYHFTITYSRNSLGFFTVRKTELIIEFEIGRIIPSVVFISRTRNVGTDVTYIRHFYKREMEIVSQGKPPSY